MEIVQCSALDGWHFLMGSVACLKCALKMMTLLNCLKWQIDQLKGRRNKQQLLMQNVLTVWELISQVCLWNNITKPPSKSHLNPSWSGPTLESKRQWVRERAWGAEGPPQIWVGSSRNWVKTLLPSFLFSFINSTSKGWPNFFLSLTIYHRRDPQVA